MKNLIDHLTIAELNTVIGRIRSILWEEDGVMNPDKIWDTDMLGLIADAMRAYKLDATTPAPAPVMAAPASVPTAAPAAKRGRKPKALSNPLLAAATLIQKTLPPRSMQHPTFDQFVCIGSNRIESHGAATNVWSFEAGSGLNTDVVVATKDLIDALQRAGEAPSFRIEGDYLVITGSAATTRVRVNTALLEDWAKSHAVEGARYHSGTIKTEVLRTIVAVAEFCSTDITRPGINYVLLDNDTVVGTDGMRLEMQRADIPPELTGVRLPAACMKALSWFENAEFRISATFLSLSTGGASLRVRLGTETFPSWRNVMPKTSESTERTSLTFKRDDLMRFMKACKNNAQGTALLTIPVDTDLEVWTHAALLKEIGTDGNVDATVEVYVSTARRKREELRVGFTPSYLAQALAVSSLPYVTLHVLDAFAPVVVSDNAEFISAVDQGCNILMPKRI